MASLWKLKPRPPLPPGIADLAERLSVSPLLAELLWARGLRTAQEMDEYLSPGLKRLAHPSCIPGLEEGARVLAQGLSEGRKLAVWGDYDVDGVTSSALVSSFLAERGHAVRVYLPDRLAEGYGLNIPGLERLAAEGVELLLTVDCGITNLAEVDRARELGMTVVVTDHHQPGPELPRAQAVCNPKLSDNPCRDLAGVGVAFMLMGLVNRLLPGTPADIRRHLDLVALGSIADVVDLSGQNRILVKNGLLLLKEASRPGIAALKEVAGIKPMAELGAGQVGFGLAPRINAAGRLGDARRALDLLLAPDRDTALPLARELDRVNTERRAEEDRMLADALAQADAQAASGRLGLVLRDPEWHPGVIGIVASRIIERCHLPAILLCDEGGVVKGSGRSVEGFDIHAALMGLSDLFLHFGGHPMAAGLTIEPGNVPALSEGFEAAAQAVFAGVAPRKVLSYDRDLSFGEVSATLLKELELLQPFGQGNPEPLFASPELKIKGCRVFGGSHVALELTDAKAGITLKAKAWRKAEELGHLTPGQRLRIAYTPKIDAYGGIPTIEAKLKDWTLED
jgi:single-stranded-DNA-specific exonuclease